MTRADLGVRRVRFLAPSLGGLGAIPRPAGSNLAEVAHVARVPSLLPGWGPRLWSTYKRAFSLEFFASDRAAVDGVGPVDNAQAAGPGVVIRERRVVADAHAAEHLDRPVDDRGGHRRRGYLDRRDLGARPSGAVLVDQPGCLVHQQPGLVDVDTGLGDQLPHHTLLRQVLAERHPRLRAIHH